MILIEVLFHVIFSVSSKLLVPENKNKNNLLANVCNIRIKFETRKNSKQITYQCPYNRNENPYPYQDTYLQGTYIDIHIK